jgi:hypothetical protein
MLSVLYRINPSICYRCVVVFVAIAVFAYTLTLCIITGGPCNPLKSGTTKCLENVALSHAVLNIASDFAVVAVPIPTIHSLNFSLKQKISVGCILALGSAYVPPFLIYSHLYIFSLRRISTNSEQVSSSAQ